MQTDLGTLSTQIQTLWLLSCTALVLFMQAGFTVLEAGSVRHKNSINVAVKNVVTLVIAMPVFYMIGYALTFVSCLAGTSVVLVALGIAILIDVIRGVATGTVRERLRKPRW